jgi:mRNA interferase HigB
MRVLARNTLVEFYALHPETKSSLEHWLCLVRAAQWKSPNDVRDSFPKASVLNGERVRFEVAGGSYRLIVAFDFGRQVAYVKFLGTHAEYDRVDALKVSLF